MRFFLAVGALAGALAASVGPARAAQFVLFDAKFTYTKMDADTATPNKSHYYITSQNKDNPINPARPTNWLAPVDYRNGTLHVRTEVIDKPAGSEITQWFFCYIAARGAPGTDGYGCAGTGTYKEEGVIEHDEAMTSWWNNTAIDWTQGIKQVDLIMKDFGTGNGGNYTHLRPDPEHFFPTTVRITVIQVAKGSTYDPSLVPLPPPGSDGGVVADAGPPPAIDGGPDPASTGSGGANGSGGASGSGGAPPSPGTGGSPPAMGSGGHDGSGGAPGATGGGVSSGCAIAPGGAASGATLLFALLALTRVRRRRG